MRTIERNDEGKLKQKMPTPASRDNEMKTDCIDFTRPNLQGLLCCVSLNQVTQQKNLKKGYLFPRDFLWIDNCKLICLFYISATIIATNERLHVCKKKLGSLESVSELQKSYFPHLQFKAGCSRMHM